MGRRRQQQQQEQQPKKQDEGQQDMFRDYEYEKDKYQDHMQRNGEDQTYPPDYQKPNYEEQVEPLIMSDDVPNESEKKDKFRNNYRKRKEKLIEEFEQERLEKEKLQVELFSSQCNPEETLPRPPSSPPPLNQPNIYIDKKPLIPSQ